MQQKDKKHVEQVEYLGRWIDKKHFRVFVYAKDGSQKLANNYDEYQKMIGNGEWFATKNIPIETKLVSPTLEKMLNQADQQKEIKEPKEPKEPMNESTVTTIEKFKQTKNEFKSGRRSRNI